MKHFIYIIYCGLLAAALHLRAFVPGGLVLPVYLILVLLPQLIFLWFKTEDVIEAYEAYKKAKEQEKVFSTCRKRRHYDSVFYIANRQTIMRRSKITPTRAVKHGDQWISLIAKM